MYLPLTHEFILINTCKANTLWTFLHKWLARHTPPAERLMQTELTSKSWKKGAQHGRMLVHGKWLGL